MKVIWTLVKQQKFISFLNILASSAVSLLILAIIMNVGQSNIEMKTVQNFEGMNLYQLSDGLFNEKEREFFSNEDSYSILNDFAGDLTNSSSFIYYDSVSQPIGVVDFKGDEKFEADYESGREGTIYDKNNKEFKWIKSIQLNSTAFDLHNIQISSGRGFTEDEYLYSDNKETIPIILGAEYSSVYTVGDHMNIDLYFKEFKGEIIGFLDSSQKVMTTSEPELLLDRYIVIPAMLFQETPTVNNEDDIFPMASLLSRINGLVITEETPLSIREEIDRIGQATGFQEFEIIGANSLAVGSLIKMTKVNRNILYLVTGMLFILSIVLFLFNAYFKIKKNLTTYTVFLISGAHYTHIYKYLTLEFLVTLLIGSCLPIMVLPFVVSNSSFFILNYLYTILVYMAVILLIIHTSIKFIFKKIDLVQLLKG